MKVLHVLNTNKFSGAENVVCQIIQMFNKTPDIEMAYISPDGSIRNVLNEKGIKFFPVSRLTYFELKKVVNEYNPDIIHGHDIRGAVYASCFHKQARIIHTIHGNDLRMRRVGVKSLYYYVGATKATHIFWVSKTCYEQYIFRKLVHGKSSVLYNVIDSESTVKRSMEDSKEYSYDIVFVGRLAYPKNPERVIDVLRKVIEKDNKISVAIIGEGDKYSIIKDLIAAYKLEKNIEMLGFKENPLKVLSCSKVMVLTSEWEGTPMVALEAMALGIPIVSTRTDGMCEMIESGVNGYLTDNNDEFSNYVLELVRNRELWNSMHNKQIERNKIVNDIQKYRKVLETVYRKLL